MQRTKNVVPCRGHANEYRKALGKKDRVPARTGNTRKGSFRYHPRFLRFGKFATTKEENALKPRHQVRFFVFSLTKYHNCVIELCDSKIRGGGGGGTAPPPRKKSSLITEAAKTADALLSRGKRTKRERVAAYFPHPPPQNRAPSLV